MNFNMILPGMKDVQIISIEEKEVGVVIHPQMPHQLQTCPSCGQKTSKIHDYRMQKIKHLKWFERATYLFYKRRRYRCSCGIQTFKNWQMEILNSFVFSFSNGFLEGINNKTKVMKRNAYGFKCFDHFKAKILLNLKYKNVAGHVG